MPPVSLDDQWTQLYPKLSALLTMHGTPVERDALDHLDKAMSRLQPLVQQVDQTSTNRQRVILFVDDEPDILIIVTRNLRHFVGDEYEVVGVPTGADALAQLAISSVVLVITDYNMPGINGLQLTEQIRELSPATAVGMITAYHTPALEQKAKDAGVNYYLPKPFPLDRLERMVRAGIELYHARISALRQSIS